MRPCIAIVPAILDPNHRAQLALFVQQRLRSSSATTKTTHSLIETAVTAIAGLMKNLKKNFYLNLRWLCRHIELSKGRIWTIDSTVYILILALMSVERIGKLLFQICHDIRVSSWSRCCRSLLCWCIRIERTKAEALLVRWLLIHLA